MFCVETIQDKNVGLSEGYLLDGGVGATGIAYNIDVAPLAEEAD
jgi:hypothetical protein